MNRKEIAQRLDTLESEASALRKILQKKEGTIIERIKTFEDVCEELGYENSEEPLPFGEGLIMTPDRYAINAFAKVSLIAKALNEGWTPNWDDSSECKYYPWFDMSFGSGSGVSLSFSNLSTASTGVGSRLCFKSRELCEYAAKQFEDVYKQLFTL